MKRTPGQYTRMARILTALIANTRHTPESLADLTNQDPLHVQETIRTATQISNPQLRVGLDPLERDITETDTYDLEPNNRAYVTVRDPRHPEQGFDVLINSEGGDGVIIDVHLFDPTGARTHGEALGTISLAFSDHHQEDNDPIDLDLFLVRRTIDQHQLVLAENENDAQHRALENGEDAWETSDENYETEPHPNNDDDVITVTFQPQAWVNDNAIDVDAEGPTTFTAPKALLEQHQSHDLKYDLEVYQDLPNLPEWIRNWDGPYFFEIDHK